MPASNRELLERLLSTRRVASDRGHIFDRSAEPLISRFRFDPVEGMLLGLSIADALGAVSERMRPETRKARFGEIRHYPPNPWAGGRPVGTPTDDSQLAFLETLPSVLYILSLYGTDPEEAILRTVNDTRADDTCGAIVGVAVGALHRASTLPRPWKENLTGWLRGDDGGRIFEFIDLSSASRWPQNANAHSQ